MSVGLRLCAIEFTSRQLKVLAYLTVSELLPESFPHTRRVMAVQRSFCTQEAAVCTCSAEWEEVRRILELVRTANVTVESLSGTTLWTRDSVCVPVPQDDEFPLRLLVHPKARDQSHHVEATSLGGRDLGYPEKWNISLRSDPEGQHVYGPSLANVENTIVEANGMGGATTKQVSALGLSKATHEFLTLHYFAIDSAAWWEQILQVLIPKVRFPGAVVRRAVAISVFEACHIAPSHRRYPHPLWNDSFSLMADLLLGCGVGRYLGCFQGPAFEQVVALRGFSAGSFSGLCFLHILWPIPGVVTKGTLGAIACPPALLTMGPAKEGDELHLVHYESDELCCWKPGRPQLEQCCTKFTYVMNESSAYKGHYGSADHGYVHWLGLNLPGGILQLSQLLFLCPEAAAAAKRDETPLRLISWLNYKLDPDLESFIEKAMQHLSTREHDECQVLLQLGAQHVKHGDQVRTETELRDRLIDLVSVGNLRHKPEALFSLFRKFLQRISLPRLIHFFDLVLPQLMPVQAAWAGEGKTLWSCHHIRYLHTLADTCTTPRVKISYVFTSHDHIHHVRIQWEGHPLLLFSGPKMVEPHVTERFREQASHVTHQQHLQMRLRKGMAILVYYVVGATKFQVVLLAHDSVLGRGGKSDNRLWKRVTPIVTEFAWLPPTIAESFCGNALYREDARTYLAFDTPHLGLRTKRFDAHLLIEDIFYLGDTRSADDLAVFTGMSPERLCLGCGLRVVEPFTPLATGERLKLFTAAHKLLMFVLHDVSAQAFNLEEQALHLALRPLIENGDGHFVAAVVSLVQSLLEGRTDCPISGVFGAGKTLSAAAMIAGLLVMDPTLKIMIVTKVNVAAHAFAKHFLRLELPGSINSLVGRLVGYVELQKGPANKTDLDVPPAFRNDVLRSKQILIGCGGGFHQECSQPYSPVAKWIEDADVTLNDEGHGNLDEASAVARTPRTCIVIWCGDHKQTPGGLRKTDEAKAFRRKLLRRPIALRGDTEYLQPNMLGKVVLRYLEEVDDPVANAIRALILETLSDARQLISSVATLQSFCQEIGCDFHRGLCSPVFCTAVVVLWLALYTRRSSLFWQTPFKLQQESLASRGGRLFSPAVPEFRWLPIPLSLLFVTLSWIIPRMVYCALETICSVHKVLMVVSSRYSGMRRLLTCMQLLTLAALLNGCKASSN